MLTSIHCFKNVTRLLYENLKKMAIITKHNF